ncbi:MAG: hypothetical protein IPM17_14235 [Verrucomicrobia bacterium]|nr:hypothetical protein [Verrucomicrobiota bacterium]
MRAAAPWGTPIMQPGIAALTCAAQQNPSGPTNAFPFGLVDLRNPSPVPHYTIVGPAATLWNPPMYHHPDWSVDKIGCVFGIAVDRDGNIYLGAHSLYVPYWGPPSFGNPYLQLGSIGGSNPLNASGTIYRVDAMTGNVTVFAVLPQLADPNLPWNPSAGPGIGNLSYDAIHDQLFATNLEDGKIYRLTKSGTVGVIAEVFDPLAPDSGVPGMPPLGDRLWAIEVSGSRVFYSVWDVGNVASPTVIRRVDIAPSGALIPASDAPVLTVPANSVASAGWVTTPVSDLTFSQDGNTMILAERGMYKLYGMTDFYATGNHAGRVLRANWSGSAWTVTHAIATGKNVTSGEAYGGADFGPEGGVPEALVWMSSADMATGAGPHGIQGLRMTDFPAFPPLVQATNSYLVPYDPAYTAAGPDVKGIGGDVEIMPERACSRLTVERITCPEKQGLPFTVTFQVQNLSGQTVQYGWWNPWPTNNLPPGGVTFQPLPAGVFPLPGGSLTNLGTVPLSVQLPANLGGQTVCFSLTLLDDKSRVCCTEKICVELPVCDCARIVTEKIECHPLPGGAVNYSLTLVIQNLTHLSANPFPFYHVTFLPPTGFSPSNVTPVPSPIPPGGSGTVTVTYTGLPGKLCFTLGLHDEDIEPCCFIPVCLDLPDCREDPPDLCAVETVVPCRPGPPGTPPGLGTATLHYTLCNNSTAPRTYAWSVSGTTPAPPCTKTLTPADFSPASGTVTVGPGACITIPITVTCREWNPGECASFVVCATPVDPGAPAFDLCCEGTIRAAVAGAPLVGPVVDPVSGPPALSSGGSADVTLEVFNPGDSARTFTVVVRSSDTLLGFGSPDGRQADFQPYLRAVLEVPPGGQRPLSFRIFRTGDSVWDPSVSQVEVVIRPGVLAAEALLGEAADLAVPVIRQQARAGTIAPPRITGFELAPGNPPRAVLRLSGEAGARYRIERAREATGPWTAAASVDGKLDAEGMFWMADRTATCELACEPGEDAAFFRVVGWAPR